MIRAEGNHARRGIAGFTSLLLVLVALHSPALASTGDMEIVLGRFASGPVHAIRWSSGYWTRWGDIGAASRTPLQDVSYAAIARVNGTSHTVVVYQENAGYRLGHAIRDGAGYWTVFTNMEPFTGDIGDPYTVAAAGMPDGSLHVLAVTPWTVWHAVRRPDGSWSHFAGIYSTASPVFVNGVALASASGNTLHAAIVLSDGRLLHGEEIIGDRLGWRFNELDRNVVQAGIGTVGRDVHVAAIRRSGELVHRQRYANMVWSPFLDVAPYTGHSLPWGQLMDVAVSGSANGEVHVAVIVGVIGPVYHALRFPSGAWSTFNEVDAWTGNDGGYAVGLSMAAQ